MSKLDLYHTVKEFDVQGLERFIEHTKNYFKKKENFPVCKSNCNSESTQVTFTFTNTLLNYFICKPSKIKKPYEVAIKYGFRGFSKGGKNGIFYVRNLDKGLLKAIPELESRYKNEIISDLLIDDKEINKIKDVKIVWHNNYGERILGKYNTNNNRIIFLDFANY